jgi:hypothetical protein
MKDQTTSIGAQRLEGGGAPSPSSVAYDRADCHPRTSRGQSRRCRGLSTACTDRSGDCGVGRTCRHEPASFPCGRSACHAPGRTLLRPYGSSGRAPARTVAGDSPAWGGSPGGGGAALLPGAGRGGEATRTARRGTQRVRPAVPRTDATAGAAPMLPGVAGQAWPAAPARWQAAVWVSRESLAPAHPPAGVRPRPARAGECAW